MADKDLDFSGIFEARGNLLDQRKAEERRIRRRDRKDQYKEIFAKGFAEELFFNGPERRRKQQLAVNLAEADNVAKNFNMQKTLERYSKRQEKAETIDSHPGGFLAGVRNNVKEEVLPKLEEYQKYSKLDLSVLPLDEQDAIQKNLKQLENNYVELYTPYWKNILETGKEGELVDEGKTASTKLLNALSANAYYESEKGVGIFGAIEEGLGFNSGTRSKLKGAMILAEKDIKDYMSKVDDLLRVPILKTPSESNIETYLGPSSAVTKDYEAETKSFAAAMTRVDTGGTNDKDKEAKQAQEIIGTVGNIKLKIGEDVSTLSEEDKNNLPIIEAEGFNIFKGKVKQTYSFQRFFGADEFSEQVSDERSSENYLIRRKKIVDGKVSYENQNMSMEAAMASYLPKIADQLKAQDIDRQTGRPRQEGNKYYYYNLAKDALIRNGNIYIRPSDTNNPTEGKVVFDLPANVVDLSAGEKLPKDGFGITDFLYTKMQLAQDKNSLTQDDFFDKAYTTEINELRNRLENSPNDTNTYFIEGKIDLLNSMTTDKLQNKYLLKSLIAPSKELENTRVVIGGNKGIEKTRIIAGTLSKEEAEKYYLSYINGFNDGEDDLELYNVIINRYK